MLSLLASSIIFKTSFIPVSVTINYMQYQFMNSSSLLIVSVKLPCIVFNVTGANFSLSLLSLQIDL